MFKRFLVSLILIITFVNPLLLSRASADSGYRYWGYFQASQGATTWTAAMTGPSVKLKDGDVEGWTFTASSNDIPATAPMMDPDFKELCGNTSEVSGKIRVGLVVDFGAPEIAPAGETPKEFFSDCVVVSQGSTGLDLLQAVLPVRADKSGLICGIGGYPANECGAPIELPVASASTQASPLIAPAPTDEKTNSNRSLAIGGIALFAFLVTMVAIRRKR